MKGSERCVAMLVSKGACMEFAYYNYDYSPMPDLALLFTNINLNIKRNETDYNDA